MFKLNALQSMCTRTDSYKVSHYAQYPEGSEYAEFYVESRGGDFTEIVTAGINYLVKILDEGVTHEQVQRASKLMKAHFGYELFNEKGWMALADYYAENKSLPLRILAAPEGSVVPTKNVVAIVSNTHKDFVWLPGYLETFILRAIWYPSTVATLSRECKKVLKKYLERTSDLQGDAFDFVLKTRLHDFGARGVSSGESAAIGGLAHLYNFIGTDTVEGMILAQELFNYEGAAGISVAAREHSTVTCYGIEWEKMAYLNSVEKFGDKVYAIVYDSTDFKKAVAEIASYKDEVIARGGTLVVRPDSGNMIDNIMYALETLGDIFGYERNSKGFKVLSKHCRVIQGDEITGPSVLERVLSWMEMKMWSSENIAFGMGGGLLQMVNRDTCKYAMKMSALRVNGEWRDVFKCPKGAEWKMSKKGRLDLWMNPETGEYATIKNDNVTKREYHQNGFIPVLEYYYVDGIGDANDTLEVIRERAEV